MHKIVPFASFLCFPSSPIPPPLCPHQFAVLSCQYRNNLFKHKHSSKFLNISLNLSRSQWGKQTIDRAYEYYTVFNIVVSFVFSYDPFGSDSRFWFGANRTIWIASDSITTLHILLAVIASKYPKSKFYSNLPCLQTKSNYLVVFSLIACCELTGSGICLYTVAVEWKA